MNKKLSAPIVATLLAVTSFSTLAATQVNESQASSLHSMGTVSISGARGTLDDATHKLAKKADAMGASSYRIIGVTNPADSSLWFGNAEIYR
ncbi:MULTISPECIES: DUF1471 domain-containing protein [Erwinia]|uniref:DUF1471 domain-containing protein n=1 Tax=Erwinia pyrifoliae TaxID=79967 RepID=A0ABY5XAS2_ERWPY|nr:MULTISPECIES: DUF1471 domain-containing protein [Erwinia]ADP13243.1 conserved uncharacterized protein [Erwinia sp. Ejp617]AUX73325.1 DUF1471 domain-containing protein [Erwinia pyrifoliae]MCA8876382.1 DUF1471 domain-containing protein [Erwinia pyrifoliae]MCT2386499.1 DUF1471 domain-containing protein [Erwinia pyrifoliae]MCU8587904.1 DUF1471 domain-containing protein [Erwinia pyrifoliae]